MCEMSDNLFVVKKIDLEFRVININSLNHHGECRKDMFGEVGVKI